MVKWHTVFHTIFRNPVHILKANYNQEQLLLDSTTRSTTHNFPNCSSPHRPSGSCCTLLTFVAPIQHQSRFAGQNVLPLRNKKSSLKTRSKVPFRQYLIRNRPNKVHDQLKPVNYDTWPVINQSGANISWFSRFLFSITHKIIDWCHMRLIRDSSHRLHFGCYETSISSDPANTECTDFLYQQTRF